MENHRTNIASRVLDRISVLRDEFGKNTAYGPFVYHALIVFRDDLEQVSFGPTGLVEQDMTITLPGIRARDVSTFHGMTVITPPVWTEHGRRFGAETAYKMLPDARRLLVEKPGLVADSFTVIHEVNSACTERTERFQHLAADAGRLLEELRTRLSTHGILDYNFGRGSDEDVNRWLVTLHRLAWRMEPESSLRATRNCWRRRGKRVAFFPYDETRLRQLASVPALAETMQGISIPPDRYVSVIEQDVFLASMYALDDVLFLAGSTGVGDALSKETGPPKSSSRDGVFVSYAHSDERWLTELEQMLAPAVRNQVIKVWHDREIKPGEIWRNEIAKELKKARVGVILVTKSCLASGFIQDVELPYLLDAAASEGVTLLWIAVDHCMYEQTELKEIQAINDPATPWTALRGANLQREIKSACQKILAAYGPCPEAE